MSEASSAASAAAPATLAALGPDVGVRLRALLADVDPAATLDADAEELLLSMADDFVKRIAARAAQLARHRRSESLDARDLRFCLGRHWGITVPAVIEEPEVLAAPAKAPAPKEAPKPKAKAAAKKRRAAPQADGADEADDAPAPAPAPARKRARR